MLIEAAAAYTILVTGIVTIVPIFQLAIKSSEKSRETLKAAELAQELMEEVKLRRWDDSANRRGYPDANGNTTLGVESGEVATNKATFEDVDDFNGWTEARPQNPVGTVIPGLAGYARTVTVAYVDSSFAVSASTTAYKKVTVCVAKASVTLACLYWVATNF